MLLWGEYVDGAVKVQPARLHQLRGQHRGHRLADAGDAHHAPTRARRPGLDVGEAQPRPEPGSAVHGDAHGEAGHSTDRLQGRG